RAAQVGGGGGAADPGRRELSGPHLGDARLAPGGPRSPRGDRGRVRRRLGRRGEGARSLPALARDHATGGPGFGRRHAPTLLAAASAQALARSVSVAPGGRFSINRLVPSEIPP